MARGPGKLVNRCTRADRNGMPGLSLAADADAVIVWLDRLSLDETEFDNLAALDGAELSLGERMSNILIKAAGVPWVTESHHRLALRLLMVGADPNRPSTLESGHLFI